jgi:TfoX/Sxy family transcriptional regulator of competence genes
MPYDPGLVERVAEAFVALGISSARQKNVFGGRGFMVGKSAAVIVWDDRLLVKTPPSEYAAALGTTDVTPFAPGGERAMSTWVVVPPDAMADDPELRDWVARGLRGIGRG